MDDDFPQEVRIEINGELDLHHFSPKDLKFLIPDYLQECHDRKIYQVRIIHGKGIGNLRRTVHSLLEKNHLVADFKLADRESGSWGATLVELKRGE